MITLMVVVVVMEVRLMVWICDIDSIKYGKGHVMMALLGMVMTKVIMVSKVGLTMVIETI